jgi:methionyl-tRNA synthetase
VDAFRYFLMAEMTLGQDANFSEDAFVRRFNADLANDLGNLLSRVINMTKRFCDGLLPPRSPRRAGATGGEGALGHRAERGAADGEIDGGDAASTSRLAQVITAVKAVNRFLEVKQPWTLAKQDDKTPLHTALYVAAETLGVASALLQPVMPAKMAQLRKSLGLPEGGDDERFEPVRPIETGDAGAGSRTSFPARGERGEEAHGRPRRPPLRPVPRRRPRWRA